MSGKVIDETTNFTPGTLNNTFEIDGVKCGLQICYDLRFPEGFKKLWEDGANIIFIPSAFYIETGKAHFEILLRSRAIDYQLFIIAPAQGNDSELNKYTFGHSMAIDPWGNVLTKFDETEKMEVVEINLEEVSRVRNLLQLGGR